jgi:hypothetical protein
MRLPWACARLVVTGAALSACGATSHLIGNEPGPASDRPVSFENVVVADDGRSARVDFIGGKEFDPDDACSVAYRGTAEIIDADLEIDIYAEPHPKPLPLGTGCPAMGYSRTLTLNLDVPFTGTVVRDLAGQVFLLAPPEGLATIGALPDGWELRREGNLLGSATPRWERVWSPDPDPWPAESDSMLTLYQAFGGPVSTTGGDPQPPVDVNGERAAFYLHPPTGEMVVVWSLGHDELALVGNLNDFSQDEFLAIAASVQLPSD